jgi:hypothetical protein
MTGDVVNLDRVAFQAILPLSLHKRAAIRGLLEAIESVDGLRPDYWGPAPGLRDPYDARAVEEHFARNEGPGSLVRTRSPSLSVSWHSLAGASSLEILLQESTDGELVDGFFRDLDLLVDKLQLDFAHVDVRFVGQARETKLNPSSSFHHLEAFLECGFEHLFARNYFSVRIQALFENSGSPCLRELLARAHGLPRGTLRSDLTSSSPPWLSTPESLKAAQQVTERCLSEAGFLAHRVNTYLTPGPRWVPPNIRSVEQRPLGHDLVE